MSNAIAECRSIYFLSVSLFILFCAQAFPQHVGDQQDRATFTAPKAKAKFAPGQIIVRFKDQKSDYARAQAHARLGATAVKSFKSIPSMQLVKLPTTTSVAEALKQYRNNPDVLYAEPDYLWYPTEKVPNDPSFSQLWALKNIGLSGGTPGVDIKATAAWDLTTGSKDVVVAIIDTGIDYNHPDLASSIFHAETNCSDGIDDDRAGYVDDCQGINTSRDGNSVTNPIDYIGHGTHVAGTIGAAGNNGIGVTGINWDVRILPCKFIKWDGGTTSGALECLDYIAKLKESGVNIVASNNSWGGLTYSRALLEAIQKQLELGILFITAAGNGGWDGVSDNNDEYPYYPAEYDLPNMISVAATDRTDKLATFSNYGKHSVHIGAPGVGILSTFPGDYAVMNGTSMATPHVTGVAALLKAYNPSLDWRAIKNLIVTSGDTVPAPADSISGKRLNAYQALTCSGAELLARTDPRTDLVTTTTSVPVLVTVMHVNCAEPAGEIVATISPGGETLTLRDDGTGPDIAAGDGVYSANFQPSNPGHYTVTLPNSDTFTVEVLHAYAAAVFNPQPYRVIAGTNLELEDEETRELVPPFPIHFGGATFSKLYVGDNGTLSIGRAFTSGNVFPIPFPGLPALIAPWWDDFAPIFPSDRNVFWEVQGTAPTRELIVEWRNLPLYGGPGDGAVTFQAVLFEDRDDILFSYKDTIFGTWFDWPHDNANSATIGIQVSSVEGTQYLPYQNPAFSSGSSLLFATTDNPDFEITLNDAQRTALAGQPIVFSGHIRALYGYDADVTVTCSGTPPEDCTTATVRATREGTDFSLTVTSRTAGDNAFQVRADGADTLHRSHSASAVLHVQDFQFTAPSPASLSIPNGQASTTSFQAQSLGSFSGTVSLACDGLPTGAACSFSPSAMVSLSGAAPANVTVTVKLAPRTPVGGFDFQVIGTGYMILGGPTRVQRTSVHVEVSPSPDFFLTPATSGLLSDPQHSASTNLTLTFQDGFSGPVTLSCSVVPAGPTCSIDPQAIGSNGGIAVLQVSPTAPNGWAYSVAVTGTSGNLTHSVAMKYVIFEMNVQPTAATVLYVGNYNDFPVNFTPGIYKGKAIITCDLTAISPTTYCDSYASSYPVDFSAYTGPLRFATQIPVGTPYATYPMAVRLADVVSGQTASFSIPVQTQGLTWESPSSIEQTVVATQSTQPFEFLLTPHNGFSLKTRLALGTGIEFPRKVEFIPATDLDMSSGPVSVKATITIPKGDTPGGGTYRFRFYGQPVDTTSLGYPYLQFPSTEITLHIQDFRLTYSSQVVHVAPGGSTELTITNTEYEGLNVPVQLGCPAEMPPGISCSFDKPAIGPGESTKVAVTAAASAEPGYRAFGILGTAVTNGIEIQHTFPLSLDSSHITAELAPSETLTVTPTTSAEFAVYADLDILGPVSRAEATVDCLELPPGVSCETYGPFLMPGYGPFTLRATDGVTPLGVNDFKVRVTAFGETRTLSGKILFVGSSNIEVLSPADQDIWADGSHTIIWHYSGDPGPAVRLELYDNGQFAQVIADHVPSGTNGKGSYVWAIPDSLKFSSHYAVRIVSNTDSKVQGQSAGRVWIGRGVEFYGLHPGNVVYTGSWFFLYYTYASCGLVNFDLYRNGQFVRTIISGASSYEPHFPNHTAVAFMGVAADWAGGTGYQMKAVSQTDPSRVFAVSETFTVVNSSITVTSPAAGDIWRPGSRQTVSWKWTGDPIPPGQDVQIYMGGWLVTRTTPIGNGGAGQYTWTVPADVPPGNFYQVSVATNTISPMSATSGKFAVGNYSNVALTMIGSGLVRTPDYMAECNASCRMPFLENSAVVLTAVSMGAYEFKGWSGPCTGTGDCRFTMPAGEVALTATFAATVAQDFNVALSATQSTVSAATPAKLTVSVSPNPRFDSLVNLSCINVPAALSCAFSPSALTPGTATPTAQLTVTKVATGSSLARSQRRRDFVLLALALLPFAGLVLLTATLNPSQRRGVALLGALVSSVALCACGGGGSVAPPPPPPPTTYTITVVAQSGAVQRTANLTVTLK